MERPSLRGSKDTDVSFPTTACTGNSREGARSAQHIDSSHVTPLWAHPVCGQGPGCPAPARGKGHQHVLPRPVCSGGGHVGQRRCLRAAHAAAHGGCSPVSAGPARLRALHPRRGQGRLPCFPGCRCLLWLCLPAAHVPSHPEPGHSCSAYLAQSIGRPRAHVLKPGTSSRAPTVPPITPAAHAGDRADMLMILATLQRRKGRMRQTADGCRALRCPPDPHQTLVA